MGTFEKHMRAVQSGRIDRANVIGIRKAFNAYEREAAGYGASRTSPKWTREEVTAMHSAIGQWPPYIKGELRDSGLKLLQSPRYAKRLAPVAAKIPWISAFRLARFDAIDPKELHWIPVYHAFDGGQLLFTFRNIPWQTAFVMGLESGPTIERNF